MTTGRAKRGMLPGTAEALLEWMPLPQRSIRTENNLVRVHPEPAGSRTMSRIMQADIPEEKYRTKKTRKVIQIA